MKREPNAVDFWRGYALVAIFVNHIPGNFYSHFTHANFSISDSADLFVFLAGWSARLLSGHGERQQPIGYIVLRLSSRAVTIYAAQVMITMLAIAILATAAILRDNPLLLEWHNAAAVFHDPVRALIGVVTLGHQIGYFNILPLYVVLMLMAPFYAALDRVLPQLVLPVSAAIYLTVLATRFNLPSWPVKGEWFFDPLAWQFIFVLGFVLGKPEGIGLWVRRHIVTLRWIGLPFVILFFVLFMFNIWFDPTTVPEPRLFFMLDKTFESPTRVFQFLTLIAVMSVAFRYLHRFVPPLVSFLALLGRNSLNVFCMGSLLSLTGQIVRAIYRGYLSVDTLFVVVGIAILALTAWLPEWREEIRRNALARARIEPQPEPQAEPSSQSRSEPQPVPVIAK